MKTPETVISELDFLRAQIARNATDIREMELKAAEESETFTREYATAYKRAEGSVEDRKQTALLDTARFKAAKDRALIELAFVKQRGRDLEFLQSNLQTQARLLDTHLRASTGVTR